MGQVYEPNGKVVEGDYAGKMYTGYMMAVLL